MKIEVKRYLNSSGWPTRNWAVYLDGELLAVTVYRKGAEAVAGTISNLITHATSIPHPTRTSAMSASNAAGMASR